MKAKIMKLKSNCEVVPISKIKLPQLSLIWADLAQFGCSILHKASESIQHVTENKGKKRVSTPCGTKKFFVKLA